MEKELKGKAVGSATVGAKGQIVIPQEMRNMFDIKPGDNLILFADINRGIAILKSDVVEKMAKKGLGNE